MAKSFSQRILDLLQKKWKKQCFLIFFKSYLNFNTVICQTRPQTTNQIQEISFTTMRLGYSTTIERLIMIDQLQFVVEMADISILTLTIMHQTTEKYYLS